MMAKLQLLLLICCCALLGGCASLQLLSFGASSISYAVSGKSLSDHAISTVMDQDCALHRSLLGEQACIDEDESGILRAEQPSPPVVNAQAQASLNSRWQLPLLPTPVSTPALIAPKPVRLASASQSNPDQTVLNLMAAHASTSTSTSTSTSAKPQLFAVVGSFNRLDYARHNLGQHRNVEARIVTSTASQLARGATRYRVVIGPLAAGQFDHKLGDLGNRSDYHAWRLHLCANSLIPPPCVNNDETHVARLSR